MSMFGPRPGTWWIQCKSDPRWAADGRALCGGLVMPVEAEEALERLKREIKEKLPDDVEWGYMRD